MYVREYDGENRPVKRTFYADRTEANPEGKATLVFGDYSVDAHGNVTEENGYTVDGSFYVRVTFRRGPAGQTLEREEYFEDDPRRNRSYRYRHNEHGHAIEARTMDAAGTVLDVRLTQYRYDSEGRMIGWTAHDESGAPLGGARHQYNVDGDRIETLDLTADGEAKRSRQFTYQFWE